MIDPENIHMQSASEGLPMVYGVDGGSQTVALEQKTRLSDRFRNSCIGMRLVIDTAFSELDEGLHGATLPQKAALSGTSALAVGGQIYERARIPEIIAYSQIPEVYQRVSERSGNNAVATLAAMAVTYGLVYGQQKIIGKNWVYASQKFPDTYDTVNNLWPKSVEVATNAIPSNNSLAEGYGMFNLGTTPFITKAKLKNTEISNTELYAIERRATRLGSIFATGVTGLILGAKSTVEYIPGKIGSAVNTVSDKVLDVISNVWITAGVFTAIGIGKYIKDSRKRSDGVS